MTDVKKFFGLIIILILGVSIFYFNKRADNVRGLAPSLLRSEPRLLGGSRVEGLLIALPGVEKFNPGEEKKHWDDRLKREAPEKVYEEFKAAYANENTELQHTVSHLFGGLLYNKTGVEGVAICDAMFAFGCYHSFFGSAISDKGISVLKTLSDACRKKLGVASVGCEHGIGHGLLEYLGHGKLLDALRACEKIPRADPIGGCTSGVFMEYNVPIVLTATRAYTQFREMDKKNPYAPCPNIPQEFRESCYHGLGQWWDKFFDYEKIGNLCVSVEDVKGQKACFMGVGNVAGPSSNYDAEGTIDKCKKMPSKEGEALCLQSASWSFYALEQYKKSAHDVCAGLPPDEIQKCAPNI